MPEASKYVLIPPGESREGRVDLRAAYQVEEPGTYSLLFDSLLFDVVDDESLVPRKLEDHEALRPQIPGGGLRSPLTQGRRAATEGRPYTILAEVIGGPEGPPPL